VSRISSSLVLGLVVAAVTAGCGGGGGPDAPMFAVIEAMLAIGVVGALLLAIAIVALLVAWVRAVRRGARARALVLAAALLASGIVAFRLARFFDPELSSPTEPRAVLPYRSVSGGRVHACGVDAAGRVLCLGWDAHGAAGLAEPGAYARTIVAGLGSAVSVSASIESSCAALADHTVRCWGIDPRTPSGARSGWGFDGPLDVRTLVVADDDVYALDRAGTLHALVRPMPPTMTSARVVAAAARHVCVVAMDGAVRCRVGSEGHDLVVDIAEAADASALAVAWVQSASEDDALDPARGCAVVGGTLRCWTLDRATHAITIENVATDAGDVRILDTRVVWIRTTGELVSADLYQLDETPVVHGNDFASLEGTSDSVVCGRGADGPIRCVPIGARREREPLLDLVAE
jgi:hypothetical protein